MKRELLMVAVGVVIALVLVNNLFASNAKIVTPAGIKFTIVMGGPSTIMLDSPDCTGWVFAQGPLGNARLTCIPKSPD